MNSFRLPQIDLKLLALLLAVVSWYAIRGAIRFEITLPDVPVEIRVADGWAVQEQQTDTVRVTFRGSQEDIRLLDHKQIRAVADVRTNATVGTGEARLTPGHIKGMRGVRAIRVEPDRIQVSLDRESEKQVPVKSRTVGKPLAGAVEQTVCEPATVLLRGPDRRLRETEWVYTEPVEVDGRVESFVKRCRVAPPSDTWAPRIEPADVQVRVTITHTAESLEFKDVPVTALLPPGARYGVDITPARVTIRVEGRAEALEPLRRGMPKAFIDCVDLDPSLAYDLPVQLHVPSGGTVSATATPSFAHVVLTKP